MFQGEAAMCRRVLTALAFAAWVISFPAGGWAQAQKKAAAEKPAPDLANVKYGPHERHVLDLWKAKSESPAPLMVFIHGGGFRGGSKEQLSPVILKGLLDRGISVMAINYRLSPEAKFPEHYLDCARAIQFARYRAAEWNLDPKRVACTGGSAGAGTSLWLAFHDDLADPNSDDPVLRQSTRLTCVAVNGAQSTYDPRTIREWVGDAAARHPALEGFYGLKPDELDTPKAHKLYEAAAPINYLTADDPPVYAFYNEPRGPLPENARPGQGIHHINFGLKLKEKMDALKIECVIRHADEGQNTFQEQIDFLAKHLQGTTAGNKRPPIQQLLQQKVSVNFRRTPLQEGVAEIGKQSGIEIQLDGDALKQSGYTRNMPLQFELKDVPASRVVQEILSKYDQLCLVVDAAKNAATITTKPVAAQRGLTVVELP
jgi:acetyl esterase/lipase